jgi:hypothetical protein
MLTWGRAKASLLTGTTKRPGSLLLSPWALPFVLRLLVYCEAAAQVGFQRARRRKLWTTNLCPSFWSAHWRISIALGSVIVNRIQLRRTTRIRIYDELLPKLRRAYTGSPTEPLFGAYDFPYGPLPEWFIPTVRDVYRSSVVSGGTVRRMAERLQSVTLNRHEFYSLSLRRTQQSTSQTPRRESQWQGDPEEFFEVERQVVLALDDYESHLEKRLGGLRRLYGIWLRYLWCWAWIVGQR